MICSKFLHYLFRDEVFPLDLQQYVVYNVKSVIK